MLYGANCDYNITIFAAYHTYVLHTYVHTYEQAKFRWLYISYKTPI